MRLRVVLIVLSGVVFIVSLPLFAQQVSWIWGKVISINREEKVIQVEYIDPSSEQLLNKQEYFYISPKTYFKDVKNLDELKEGDYVGIDYIKENSKNIPAWNIIKHDRKNIINKSGALIRLHS